MCAGKPDIQHVDLSTNHSRNDIAIICDAAKSSMPFYSAEQTHTMDEWQKDVGCWRLGPYLIAVAVVITTVARVISVIAVPSRAVIIHVDMDLDNLLDLAWVLVEVIVHLFPVLITHLHPQTAAPQLELCSKLREAAAAGLQWPCQVSRQQHLTETRRDGQHHLLVSF